MCRTCGLLSDARCGYSWRHLFLLQDMTYVLACDLQNVGKDYTRVFALCDSVTCMHSDQQQATTQAYGRVSEKVTISCARSCEPSTRHTASSLSYSNSSPLADRQHPSQRLLHACTSRAHRSTTMPFSASAATRLALGTGTAHQCTYRSSGLRFLNSPLPLLSPLNFGLGSGDEPAEYFSAALLIVSLWLGSLAAPGAVLDVPGLAVTPLPPEAFLSRSAAHVTQESRSGA